MITVIKNQISNIAVPPCVEKSLLGWYAKYTKIVGVFHCIKIDRETWIGVAGDGDNGSYEWFRWDAGKFEMSAQGYGSAFTALREILNKEVA
jgi:hypothetical protein